MDFANWTDTEAYNKMKVWSGTGQTTDAIFCNNDTMAIGVSNYLLDNGYTPDNLPPIAGVDATPEGCSYISEGKMSFTVLQDAATQGERAVEAAIALSSGSSISSIEGASDSCKYIWIPFVPIDQSNVKQFM
jgi:inositol transport system substrate-binding protein